eukprot:m.58868 g.58868  ORF g.58868 m.58868 type:complete len:319 (-) comp7885_c1_seq1:686-1642(-)
MAAIHFTETHKTQVFMVLNYLSSISIVMLNKAAYKYGFPSITLTMIHFITTFIGLKIFSMVGIFETRRLSLWKILPLSLSFCGFVVLTNLSLAHNTVGFYQLAKVMTTPTIVFIQTLFYKMSFSKTILLSLLIVCIGVIQTTNASVETNRLGLYFAATGVIVTSFYQIWVKTKQQEMEASPSQLLYYQAPLSAAILFVVIPFVEPPYGEMGVLSTSWPTEAWVAVIGSSLMAILVNLSIFFVIGKTSPITYNVLGHFKLVTVIASGVFIFHEQLNIPQSVGIATTLVGIFAYTYFKLTEIDDSPAKKSRTITTKPLSA